MHRLRTLHPRLAATLVTGVIGLGVVGLGACGGGPAGAPNSTPTPTTPGPLELSGVTAEIVTEEVGVPREVVETESGDLLISDQTGRVFVLTDGGVRKAPFLDVSKEVLQPSSEELELGLAGFALAPDFAETGRFFTYTTAEPPADADDEVTRVDTLTRWRADPSTLRAEPDSGEVLFAEPRTIKDHVGGEIVFDSAGMLYTSFGAETFAAEAQQPDAIDGSVVRVDPNEPDSVEIFSYGYRNPWRLYHDPELGLLVGEAMWKDKFQQVTVAQEDGNFGYPEVSRETKKCWEGDQLSEFCQQTAAGDPIVPPVLEYSPNVGSIISGVVPIQGGSIPELDGSVLVSDWDGALIAATPGEAPWPHREVEIDSFEPPLYDTLWDLDHAGGAIYLMYAEANMQGGSVHRLTGG